MKVAVNWFRFEICSWNKRKIDRFRKFVRNGVNRFSRLRIDLFDWTVIEEYVHDDLQRAQAMVEDEKAARDHEDRFWQLEFITIRRWNFRFEEMDRFVTEKTDSPATESRQFRTRDKLISRH